MQTASYKSDRSSAESEARYERWEHWPVNWTAIWVGTLSAIAVLVLFGLIGVALGAHSLSPENRLSDLKSLRFETMALGVVGAFIAFVGGGWIAAKIAGILRAEPAMLHGAIVWVLVTPLLLVLTALGAGDYLGTWNGGMVRTAQGAPPYVAPELLPPNATAQDLTAYRASQAQYRDEVRQWREDTPRAVRNAALCAITALLLGLMGSVVGGWMGCGEPMTLTHYLTRQPRPAAV